MLKIHREVDEYQSTGSLGSDGETDRRKSEYGHQSTKKENEAKETRKQKKET
jgi:hypothetical protein